MPMHGSAYQPRRAFFVSLILSELSASVTRFLFYFLGSFLGPRIKSIRSLFGTNRLGPGKKKNLDLDKAGWATSAKKQHKTHRQRQKQKQKQRQETSRQRQTETYTAHKRTGQGKPKRNRFGEQPTSANKAQQAAGFIHPLSSVPRCSFFYSPYEAMQSSLICNGRTTEYTLSSFSRLKYIRLGHSLVVRCMLMNHSPFYDLFTHTSFSVATYLLNKTGHRSISHHIPSIYSFS